MYPQAQLANLYGACCRRLITVERACLTGRSQCKFKRVITVEDFAEEPTESMITEMKRLIGSIGYC